MLLLLNMCGEFKGLEMKRRCTWKPLEYDKLGGVGENVPSMQVAFWSISSAITNKNQKANFEIWVGKIYNFFHNGSVISAVQGNSGLSLETRAENKTNCHPIPVPGDMRLPARSPVTLPC